jgi:Bacterial conjugation TrbI-like protein
VSRPNGHSDNGNAGLMEEPDENQILDNLPIAPPAPAALPEFATRAKQRAKQQIQQNRFVIIAAGAIVTALLIFVAISMPHRGGPKSVKNRGAVSKDDSTLETSSESNDKSLFPITDSGRPATKETHQGFLNERDLQRTVIRSGTNTSQLGQPNRAETLGSIPPFGDTWQAPPYEAGSSADATDVSKAEREAMEKSSVMYVRKISPGTSGPPTANEATAELGLATGTRLRARLDSAASTAVRAPVLAVIEYNYEQGGEIIVPAGAKAVGHIREANRSGYVDLEFDSLLMPDGSSVPIEAAATGLDLRPLKGKVEGKNTGKNVLVRSLSGIGQAGSMLVGQGSLNQPLSESDLMRERVSNNVGEAGDEEVSRLAITQHIVVTISADTPIYVVLEQTPKTNQVSQQPSARSVPTSNSANVEQLRQLLQLQQELNQPSASNWPAQ